MARSVLKYNVVDFETEAIDEDSGTPPKSVGVAIKRWGKAPRYYAWGHPTGNGVWELKGKRVVQVLKGVEPRRAAEKELKECYREARQVPLLFHNAMFDLSVARDSHGLPLPPWSDFHDTLFVLFLLHPHAPDLKLKPSSERILGLKPEEANAVRDWLVEHKVVKKDKKEWGAFICKAPGDLVAVYACGDTTRPAALLDRLWPDLDEGMRSAYDRERRLLPYLLDNQQQGIRVDAEALEKDIETFKAERKKAHDWIIKRLASKSREARRIVMADDFNIDSDQQLAEALDWAGVVSQWTITESGQKSVSKKNLKLEHFSDQKLAQGLAYHSKLGTALSQSMEPWLKMASNYHGFIFWWWNQVRGEKGGTRTGRMSASRVMNITKKWEKDGYIHPEWIKGLTPLPLLRRYVLPDKVRGHRWNHRDYKAQEVRAFAHFEDGKLNLQFNQNPNLDPHEFMEHEILDITGLALLRDAVKIIVFRKMYGGGTGGLAEALRIPYGKAKQIEKSLEAAIPGLADLEKELKRRAKANEPLRTWGGRLYYCEPPSFSKKFKRHMTFEYKMLNYLIQGSCADCTKEAVIRYHEHPKKQGRFLVTVHDELNVSGPKSEMKVLQEAMESVGAGGSTRWGEEPRRFTVPMLSDGKAGPSWGSLQKEA